MSFCPNCGKKVSSDSAFRPSSGSNLKGTKKDSSPASPAKKVTTTEKTGLGAMDVKTYMIISTAGLGAVALLAIMMKDTIGFYPGGCFMRCSLLLGGEKVRRRR